MQGTGDEPVYVISVAARLAGLPCWVLRVLDDEGIVVPVRTDSNRRLYSDNDLTLLARVRHLTEELGVNIRGVKVILEMEKVQREKDSPAENKGQETKAIQGSAVPPALSAFSDEAGLAKTNGSHS
jgi:MerR family transcriptional regulator/heat shock protein HspR